jgi:ubiquinone/menaquinone biosynthesis C-methylase UbiE
MTITGPSIGFNDYVLGHSNQELERLVEQSRFLGELSDHLLPVADLAPGMRVLDVGCGAGDLSFLAARVVGPAGHVTSLDRSPESIALAAERALRAGMSNVRFVAAEAWQFEADATLDAVIGRLVLMYWPNASGTS